VGAKPKSVYRNVNEVPPLNLNAHSYKDVVAKPRNPARGFCDCFEEKPTFVYKVAGLGKCSRVFTNKSQTDCTHCDNALYWTRSYTCTHINEYKLQEYAIERAMASTVDAIPDEFLAKMKENIERKARFKEKKKEDYLAYLGRRIKAKECGKCPKCFGHGTLREICVVDYGGKQFVEVLSEKKCFKCLGQGIWQIQLKRNC
jgi:hypothetical protein